MSRAPKQPADLLAQALEIIDTEGSEVARMFEDAALQRDRAPMVVLTSTPTHRGEHWMQQMHRKAKK